MNILNKILARKREELAVKKMEIPLSSLMTASASMKRARSLCAALTERDIAVIAEIKRASPSRGTICKGIVPQVVARSYEEGGAAAISVLTDMEFFRGSLQDLSLVKEAVKIPVLRKDFIIDPYQLYEARSSGADAVLLIIAALDDGQFCELLREAGTIGLECLVEVHREDEVERALRGGAVMLGVNNRDLTTFQTDILTSVRLRAAVPESCTLVAESGIATAADIALLVRNGIHVFLIGEALMRVPAPGKVLEQLLAEVQRGPA